MMLSIIFFSLLLQIAGQTINKNFKYCNTDESMLKYLNSNIDCNNNNAKFIKQNKAYFTLLSKNHDQINVLGIECIKIKNTFKYYTNFFGTKFESNFDEIIELNRHDCLQMHEEQKCNDKVMKCNGNNCFKYKNEKIFWTFFYNLYFQYFKSQQWVQLQINLKEMEAKETKR